MVSSRDNHAGDRREAAPAQMIFAELVMRARSGDDAALDEMLRRTESRLQNSVRRLLGKRLQSTLRRSDVLQNSYLAMLSALPAFPGSTPDDFVAWVTRIVEHDIRRQSRWFGAARRRPPSRTSERNALARVLLESPPTPSAEFATRERQDLVRKAIAVLEPDHARIIELALLQELPHRDVAERMQRSEGACRMLLMRARAALAIELDRLSEGV